MSCRERSWRAVHHGRIRGAYILCQHTLIHGVNRVGGGGLEGKSRD